MKKLSRMIGFIGGVSSLLLWLIFIFLNPYSTVVGSDTVLLTCFLLVLPAFLALLSTIYLSEWGMLIVVIWALPISLYLTLTPGIFALMGIAWLLYLLSFILMITEKKNNYSVDFI